METEIVEKDSERYFRTFCEKLNDYENLSKLDFWKKYEIDNDVIELIEKQYKENNITDIEFEEYAENFLLDGDYQERIYEFFEPLEIIKYTSEEGNSYSEYNYWEITLTCGGPNVYLFVSDRFNSVRYEFYWGCDQLVTDINYSFKTIYEIYNLDM